MDRPKTTPKDFFLWAGAMVTLYASIVAFISLYFNYINYAFPDPVREAYYYGSYDPYQGGISYAMATLIVLTPVFLILMRLIRRDIERDHTRRDIWVRRWALFLTLFVAGATIVIDLITLLYTFLSGGDLTAAFLLKVLVVLLVAGAGFMHFLADLWGFWVKFPDRAKMIGYGVGVLVILSIIAGFFIVGTPGEARAKRLDSQRISDLQNIQWQVVNYWQQKEQIPQSLEELRDPISGVYIPVDPDTGAVYEYRPTGGMSFELCATFDKAGDARGYGYDRPYPASVAPGKGEAINDVWTHDSGRTCFDRTIDPERYPPYNKN